ncbi:MAG: hypothetical protein KBT03_00675 [Bacteroidales bacterium]|nr:hypothetical protein [Candidatus Scybalousia scybalohippi]
MGTSFNEISDLAYSTLFINYKLDNLLKADEKVFYKFLSGMVLNSASMFNGALDNLAFHEEKIFNKDTFEEDTVYVFDRELSGKEKYILALGVSISLYKRELDDVVVYRGKVTTKEFRDISNSSMLKARQERLGAMQEEFDQEITALQLNSIGTNGMDFFSNGGV